MRRAYIFLILGVWLAILPYLGFSYFWKGILTTFSGIGLIVVSFMFYREVKVRQAREGKPFDNFSENDPIMKEVKEIGEEVLKAVEEKV